MRACSVGQRSASLVIALVGLLPMASREAQAQSSLQIPLQFDFINPGAKSLAMGGAFAGVADDATATFANPAGLTLLSAPEFSIELRGTSFDTLFLERGRLSGPVLDEGIDTVAGPFFEESTGSHVGPGFLSVVYPFAGNRWVVAGYRHELVRIDQEFLAQGVFQQLPEDLASTREFPQMAQREVSITGYGGTVAYAVRRGVSIGGGLSVYRFSMDSTFRRLDAVGFLGPANPAVELGRSTQTGTDVGVAPSLGLIVGTSGRWRLGAVYRWGPTFTFQTTDGNDPVRDVTFRSPGTLAIGASFRPLPALILAAEVTHVSYSRLVREFVTDQARGVGREQDFDIDDGTEVHVGAQYVALAWRGAPKFRAGAWYDPDHSVEFRPQAAPVTRDARLFDERLQAALSSGEGRVHVTAGVGFSISSQVELNVAADLASRSRVFSTSLILRTRS